MFPPTEGIRSAERPSTWEGYLSALSQAARYAAEGVDKDPLVRALCDTRAALLPGVYRNVVWIDIFGGREYDAHQIRLIGAWIGRDLWQWLPEESVRLPGEPLHIWKQRRSVTATIKGQQIEINRRLALITDGIADMLEKAKG